LEKFAQKHLLNELIWRLDYRKRALKNIWLSWRRRLCFRFYAPAVGIPLGASKEKRVDILIALDTSKSMLAEDVKPNRFERSKLAVKDLARELKGDRIGLIAFSGSAFLQCP
jgi:Ca-activated chloride channel family protein